MVAQGVIRRVEALIDEQLADQPLARDDAVRAEEEQREQGPLLRPADRDRRAVHPYDKGAEDPELQAAGHLETPSLILL